jgi:hypothetical protein
MRMNFITRYFFKKYIKSEDECVQLISMVNLSAYQAFTDKEFRELVEFEKINEEEQNRIFNELTVTALIMLISVIGNRAPFIKQKRKNFWQEVREKIPEIFVDNLEKIGIAKEYTGLWKKVLSQRLKEYKERKEITKEALEEELKNEKLSEKIRKDLIGLETLSLSSMLHITRGKSKNKDLLKKHLKGWLCGLYYKLDREVGW